MNRETQITISFLLTAEADKGTWLGEANPQGRFIP